MIRIMKVKDLWLKVLMILIIFVFCLNHTKLTHINLIFMDQLDFISIHLYSLQYLNIINKYNNLITNNI